MYDRVAARGKQARSLLSIQSISSDDVQLLVRTALEYSRDRNAYRDILAGHRVGLVFTAPSTRTKASSWAASIAMGCNTLVFGPSELQATTGEGWKDTGAMFRLFLDSVVVRTDGPQDDLLSLAQGMPSVINGLTELEHPTQAIADACTIVEDFGVDAPVRLAYLGLVNNTARSLAWLVSKMPLWSLDVYSPTGLGFTDEELEALNAATCSGAIEQHDYLPHAPRSVDVVYTCRWHSMGKAPQGPDSLARLSAFRVDEELMRRFSGAQDATFMHDLPAARDIEVDSVVLDGDRSVVLRQASHKEDAAAAALLWSAGHIG